MEIKVCIGSACHLKGSYDVIKAFKKYISENALDEIISLKSAFCLGQCSEAVSVQNSIGELFSVSPETALTFMKELHRQVNL